jgi:hypothetical protein
LVEAAIWDVVVAVLVGEKSWLKTIEPVVAVEQSGMPALVPTVPPVQNIKDSGICPVKVICVAVLAATTPVSIGLPVALVDAYVEIRTKNVQFGVAGEGKPQLAPLGLVTPISW